MRSFVVKIREASSGYEIGEEIAKILFENGFELGYVYTGGESSWHDYVDAFHNKYSSIEEFKENVNKDFEDKKRWATELSWTMSAFHFHNRQNNVKLLLSTSESNGEKVTHYWQFFPQSGSAPISDEYLDFLLSKLNKFTLDVY